jgi:16S rRNA processing protein RimM
MNDLSRGTDIIRLGRINGLYGVKGWVKVYSETRPRENILDYTPWLIRRAHQDWQPIEVTGGRPQGKGIIAHLQGFDEREQASQLLGAEVAVYREQLSPLADDEYYWVDLQGLTVETGDGVVLGTVDYIFDAGANDVLVVSGERERLIPFLQGQTILEVDLQGGTIRVDWDPEF